MATLEGPYDKPVSSRRNLRLVADLPEPTIRSVFEPFAATHPSMPPLKELNPEQLYGGILEPTTTTRLRAILGTLSDTYPPVQTVNPARTVLDFGRFLNKTATIGGAQVKFSEHIEDITIPHEFLSANADMPRYCAVSRAMLSLIDLDVSRDPLTEPVIGSEQLLRLGHIAIFAVGQEEYIAGYRKIIRSRASV